MAAIDRGTVVRATSDQVSCDLDGEAAVLHLGSGMYYGLAGTAARVWALLQVSPWRVAGLCDRVAAEFEVDREACERDILVFLEDLRTHGLVEIAPGACDGAARG